LGGEIRNASRLNHDGYCVRKPVLMCGKTRDIRQT
jgi:hypothetical protein